MTIRRSWLSWLLVVAVLVPGTGLTAAPIDDETANEQFDTTTETPLIGDYANFAGLSPLVIEGVGLVVGLNGTGGDPAPSNYRTALLEDMKKRQVANPNAILASPNTALVVVKAYLPPLMEKGETVDVEIRIPDSAQATSLAGGHLLECNLSEHAFVPGKGVLEGHVFARAQGPVLVSSVLGGSKKEEVRLNKQGRVLGGGLVSRERELSIFLRNDFRSVRNAKRVADAIGTRFHDYDKYGIKEPMGEAKTDQKVVLKVHPRYKDNYPRYLQVVRHIAFRETPVARRVRMQRLAKELLDPDLSEKASLQLEAIGNDGVPVLKAGLKSPQLECQFFSALALAYLEDTAGIDVLEKCAREERAFRVFAISGLSTLDDADAHMRLRRLMSESVPETCYGAFRGLWTADKKEPFIAPVRLRENQYNMYPLETTGEPLVHLTMHTRPEIVVFGSQQEFRTPLYLSAGRKIMVTGTPGSKTVSVAKFEVGEPDVRREVSPNVAEVINAAAELGASYPDIAQMLIEADRQQNLPGKLAMDALPQAGRFYERPDANGKPGKKKAKIGRENLAPNTFERTPENDEQEKEAQMGLAAAEKDAAPQASVKDDPKSKRITDSARKIADEDEPQREKNLKKPFWMPHHTRR